MGKAFLVQAQPTLLQIASFASLEDSHRLQILSQAGQKEEIGFFCSVLLFQNKHL
jgi:hypothetical protein